MSGTTQPAMGTGSGRPRATRGRVGPRPSGPPPGFLGSTLRGGWAITRWVMLLALCGAGAAAVAAAAVLGLIIVINGSLP